MTTTETPPDTTPHTARTVARMATAPDASSPLPTPPRRGTVTRVAVWSATHPWLAIVVWLLLVAATFGVGVALETRAATTAELLTGESQRAQQLADDAGFHEPASELVLVTRADGADLASDAAVVGDLEQLRADLAATAHVADVTGPIPSDDGTAALFVVSLAGDPDTAAQRVDPLRATVADLAAAHPELVVQQTGSVSLQGAIDAWIGADLDQAAAISIPATLLVLLLAFGAIVMGVLPVAVGAASVLSAMGLWAAASQLVPDQGLVPHVILLIGMAVGIDYALFYSRRYREERHAGRGPVDATEIAARTAGHSILVSGTAVALSLAGLLLLGETLYSGVAIGGVLVVLVAMASSITAMPALMRPLNRWIDRPRVPFVWRLASGTRASNALGRAIAPIVRRPWVALGAAFVALGLMAAPAAGMQLTTTTLDDFPRTLPAFQAYDDVLAAFPDRTSQARVVLHADDAASSDALLDVAGEVSARAASDPAHFGEAGAPWVSQDGRTIVLDVPVTHTSTSDAAKDALAALRSTIVPDAVAAARPGASGTGASTIEAAVGGGTAQTVDAIDNLARTMPWVIGIVLALTFAFMLAVYRSVAIAVITVALNIASTLASFGLLVLIFQHRWAESLLGFTSNGHLVSWVPLMLFVILSGLSLDYHVLVVSRIRELVRDGRPLADAVLEGLTKTAGVVTSAAAVMIVVFVVFGTLTFIEMKQIGVGLAIATLLDVTLIRLVALPAALLAARRVLWWLGRTRRPAGRTSETSPAGRTSEAS